MPLSSELETDGEHERREGVERRLEEQEELNKKLKSMQTLLTGDNVGLVSSVSEQGKANEMQAQQGRLAPGPIPPQRARMDDASVSSRSRVRVYRAGLYHLCRLPHQKVPSLRRANTVRLQPCRTLYYGQGEGAAVTAIWALSKCDSRFFCQWSEWFVLVSFCSRAVNAIV